MPLRVIHQRSEFWYTPSLKTKRFGIFHLVEIRGLTTVMLGESIEICGGVERFVVCMTGDSYGLE